MNKLVRLVAATTIACGSITAVTVAGPAPAAYACDLPGQKVWTPKMTALAHSLPPLDEGQQNAYVLALQAALIGRGHSELHGTGYFGPVTKAAVQSWQRKNGINPSGHVGIQTWASLIPDDQHVPAHIPNPQLNPGDSWPDNDKAGYLHLGLRRFSDVFAWAPKVPISSDGDYTGAEVTVVQRYQERVGLNPSGILGVKTTGGIDVFGALVGGFGC